MNNSVNKAERESAIYWVGDYVPASGYSINSYLIMDKHPTLIGAGAPRNTDILIKKIESFLPIDDLEYIVIPNAGISYAGGLGNLLEKAPAARVVTSEPEARLLGFYGLLIQPLMVKEGDLLNIGKAMLRFIDSPFIGAPDAIMAYDETHKVLFSGDAFSTTVRRWRTQTKRDLTSSIETYYFTNIGDSILAQATIDRLRDLDIDAIAPGHGPVLRKHIEKYIDRLSGVYPEAA